LADATATFFEKLAARGHEPLLEKATGTLRFEIADGEHVHRWFVAIAKGDIDVSRKGGDADVVVRGDRALFARIASGRENAFAALLRGAFSVEGKPQLMLLFQRLFPSPPRKRPR
jgi:predicted lipid carrier protein YhbT